MVSGERSVRACDHAVTVNRLSSSVMECIFDDVFLDFTSGVQKRPLTADQVQTIAKNREEAEAKRQKMMQLGTLYT